jgi:hypothetical protein
MRSVLYFTSVPPSVDRSVAVALQPYAPAGSPTARNTSSSAEVEQAMVTQPIQRLTPQEYLARERAAETKSEYIDGMLILMSGATKEHVIITVNVASEIHQQLKGRPCTVFTQDMRVRIVVRWNVQLSRCCSRPRAAPLRG